MFFLNHLWMIPLLPALGAVLMLLFGRILSHRAVSVICVGTVVLAFAMSCGAFLQYQDFSRSHGATFEIPTLYTWMGANGHMMYQGAGGRASQFKIDVGILFDPLSAVWLLFVTGVGMLIHIYSVAYMGHEGGYYRFFGYLNLFMFAMLVLILANNYAVMFVGWEGVGLCSYLLIGFYFQRPSASTAANKAFIVNRIGDAGFLLGMFTLAWYFGSLNFVNVTSMARSGAFAAGDRIITLATFLLFVGACGKSAQIPLYVWLPDAMEGPTPVSALIHAATMVTAGIYMVARSNAIFTLAPQTMKVVAIVGALTAIFAASIALAQNDIKRVLAYSTISQLGYMFLALGVGAFAAGVFHVFTHAFFKALLFLCAGSVIHALNGEQDMRKMGGLKNKISTTYRTMLVGTLAIAGIPGLAGFLSKDEILWQTWSRDHGAYRFLWYVAFITALMTAFYMFRLIYLTFLSPSRVDHEVELHIHESSRFMTLPLIILAFCAIFAGFLGFPRSLAHLAGIKKQTNVFERFLDPVFAGQARELKAVGETQQLVAGREEVEHTEPAEYLLMLLSVGAAGLGWFLAARSYQRATEGFKDPIAAVPPLQTTLANKFYVDEFYDALFTGRTPVGSTRLGVMGLGEAFAKFDANVIDGGVNGTGWLTRTSGTFSCLWDKWVIDGLLVNGPAIFLRLSSYPVRLFEWGQLQFYALVMVVGLVGFIWYSIMH